MIDYSFIRFKSTLEDARNLQECPTNVLEYNGAICLLPSETYFQITSHTTDIVFGNYRVFLVDECGDELEDVTANFFAEGFTDRNGVKQVKWEFINNFEYYDRLVGFKVINDDNNDTFYSNLFLSTDIWQKYTTRIDYKSNTEHYGTDYETSNNYQAIRLMCYFKNKVNESTRTEYHQISTDYTVSGRNLRKLKQRYICHEFNEFVLDRLEVALTSSEVYFNGVKVTSTEAIEYKEGEGDSNLFEAEFTINKIDNITFNYSFQLFEGFRMTRVLPFGIYTSAYIENEGKCGFTVPPSLGSGTVTLYDASDDSVVNTFSGNDLSISSNDMVIDSLNAQLLPNGIYYIQFPSGLIYSDNLGLIFEGIDDDTTWRFEVRYGEYESTEYDNTEYLTD